MQSQVSIAARYCSWLAGFQIEKSTLHSHERMAPNQSLNAIKIGQEPSTVHTFTHDLCVALEGWTSGALAQEAHLAGGLHGIRDCMYTRHAMYGLFGSPAACIHGKRCQVPQLSQTLKDLPPWPRSNCHTWHSGIKVLLRQSAMHDHTEHRHILLLLSLACKESQLTPCATTIATGP